MEKSVVLTHDGVIATATAKSLQSGPTLCDPIPGILQARTLEWGAISFSSLKKKSCHMLQHGWNLRILLILASQ